MTKEVGFHYIRFTLLTSLNYNRSTTSLFVACSFFTFKGTWEHKLRQAEIEQTAGTRWHESQQLDDDPPVSHHIGHFLPPEEMAKFVQKQKVWIVEAILYAVHPKSINLPSKSGEMESLIFLSLLLVFVFGSLNNCSAFPVAHPSIIAQLSLP